MENQGNRPKLLSCMIRGPGPVYKLPTLVGYEGHDPSRYRNPAYTFRGQSGRLGDRTVGPGPCYNIRKLTKHGLDNSPAFTLTLRQAYKKPTIGPGPGAYHPGRCPPMNHSRRPPAYTIRTKSAPKLSSDGPGPNVYFLPSCLGPRVPDKRAQGAFTIISRHDVKEQTVGPGPAAYEGGNYDLVRKKNPAYSFKARKESYYGSVGPGPVYYPKFNTGKNQPKYSFGIRHSECVPPAYTDLDE